MFKLKSTNLIILFLLFGLTVYTHLKSQPATAQTPLATSLAKESVNNVWIHTKVNHFYGNPTDVFVAEGNSLFVSHVGGIRWYDQVTDSIIQELALEERAVVEKMMLVDNYLYIATTHHFWLVEWAEDSLIIRHHIPRQVTSFAVEGHLLYLIFGNAEQIASNVVTVLEHDPLNHTLTTRLEGVIEETKGVIIGAKAGIVYVVIHEEILALDWQSGALTVMGRLPAEENHHFRKQHQLLYGSYILIDRSYRVGGGIGHPPDGYDELLVIDISNPAELSIVSATTRYTSFMTSVGNTIYLDGDTNIEVYELNQGQLNTIGTIPIDINSKPFFITNDRFYHLEDRQIDIYDLQDGNTPVVMGHYVPLVSCNTDIIGFDDQYFLNWCRKDLRVMDPLGVGETAVLATYTPTVPESDSWYITNVLVQDQTAYLEITDSHNGMVYLDIVDLSDIQQIQSLNRISAEQLRPNTTVLYKFKHVTPDQLLYAWEPGGETPNVDIIDVSNPLQPVRVGMLELDIHVNYNAIAVADSFAYILQTEIISVPDQPSIWNYYLHTIDASDPTTPQIVHSTSISQTRRFLVHDNVLYTDENRQLTFYDLTNPQQPTKVGQYDGCDTMKSMTIYQNKLFGFCHSAIEEGSIIILNLSQPTQPTYDGSLSVTYVTNNFFGGMPKIVPLGNYIVVGEENSYNYSYGIDVWLTVRATHHTYLPFISKPR